MTRETRIGLVVGLVFIVMFGLVLSEFMSPKPPVATASIAQNDNPIGVRVQEPPKMTATLPISESVRPPQPPPVDRIPVSPSESSGMTASPGPLRFDEGGGVTIADLMRSNPQVDPAQPPAQHPQPPVAPPVVVAPPPPAKVTHKVQSGDSLMKLAVKYYGPGKGMEYKRIFEANKDRMPDAKTLVLGQELVIPPLPTATPPAAPPAVPPAAPVAPGPATDASRHAVAAVRDAAPAVPATTTDSTAPGAGMSLAPADSSSSDTALARTDDIRTPDSATAPAAPAALADSALRPSAPRQLTLDELAAQLRTGRTTGTPARYVISSGDTLSRIAARTLGDSKPSTVAKLMSANKGKIKNPDRLCVGTEIIIPR